MLGRGRFLDRMSPGEVRRASLWAGAGLIAAFLVAPLLPAHWRLIAVCADGLGMLSLVWNLGRINVSAPGWRVGLPGEYDERETAERHQALAMSYVIVVLLGTLTLSLGQLAERWGFKVPIPVVRPTSWVLLAVMGLPALPGIVLAWRQRRFDVIDVD